MTQEKPMIEEIGLKHQILEILYGYVCISLPTWNTAHEFSSLSCSCQLSNMN